MKGVPKVKKIDLTCPPKLCERPRKSERVGHQPTITSNTSPKPPKKRPPDSNLRPSALNTNNLTPLPIPHAAQPLIPEVVMFLSPIYRSISSHENLPLLSHLRERVKGSIPRHAPLECLFSGPRRDRVYLNTTCQTPPPGYGCRPSHESIRNSGPQQLHKAKLSTHQRSHESDV